MRKNKVREDTCKNFQLHLKWTEDNHKHRKVVRWREIQKPGNRGNWLENIYQYLLSIPNANWLITPRIFSNRASDLLVNLETNEINYTLLSHPLTVKNTALNKHNWPENYNFFSSKHVYLSRQNRGWLRQPGSACLGTEFMSAWSRKDPESSPIISPISIIRICF
jgi:hypothetical protein